MACGSGSRCVIGRRPATRPSLKQPARPRRWRSSSASSASTRDNGSPPGSVSKSGRSGRSPPDARRETRDARRETRDARRETRDARRETRRGYIASSRVEVSLPDTGLVGKLLAEAAARAEATVDGPRWEVAQDNPAQGEARRLAMVDARRRAEAYAQAAGLELGPIVEVAEVGAERSGGTMGMASHSVALAGGAAAEMPTHSHGLEIVAGVDVTYLLGSR